MQVKRATALGSIAAATVMFGTMFIGVAVAEADQAATITGSKASWISGSEVLSSQDTKADGKSSIAELKKADGQIVGVINSQGSGTNNLVKIPNIRGTKIQIRACVQDLSTGGSKTCGSWISTTA